MAEKKSLWQRAQSRAAKRAQFWGDTAQYAYAVGYLEGHRSGSREAKKPPRRAGKKARRKTR